MKQVLENFEFDRIAGHVRECKSGKTLWLGGIAGTKGCAGRKRCAGRKARKPIGRVNLYNRKAGSPAGPVSPANVGL
jgi:hypothetical protein